MKKLLTLTTILLSFSLFAQEDPEEFDFDSFGDAEVSKAFCTQKVNYLSPTQLISIGYEHQGAYDLSIGGAAMPRIQGQGGLRIAFNAPVISRNNFILNLGLTYWGSTPNLESGSTDPFVQALDKGLRTTGINATIFKPLNSKNFLIFQGSTDVNGNYTGFSDLNFSDATTYSATGIFGWKKDDNTMFGIGATRTYRAGQVLHIPVIFYNKTWNNNWGFESIVPARAHIRRNFGTTGMLLMGYEIEGNAFAMNNPNGETTFLRRGELKPRINYQRQIKNFIWLSAQVGWRYNYRFALHDTQNPVGDNIPIADLVTSNPIYFNLSLNLVSP